MISNKSLQFASSFIKELNKLLRIYTALSTIYYLQIDRQTERFNQELEIYLQIYCSKQQHDWLEMLYLAKLMHNNRIHKSTGKTPFLVTYRINLVIPVTVTWNSANPHSKDFAVEMEQLHAWIKKTLESSV